MSIELEDNRDRLRPSIERAQDPCECLEASIARAYAKHSSRVFALAVHFCGPAVAESVVQEVFLQYARDWPQFDSTDSTVRTHLLALAWQECVALSRSPQRRRPQQCIDSPAGAEADGDGDLTNDPGLEVGEFGLLDLLPAHLADPIAIVHFGACTYREAAMVLGLAPDIVKSRIREGLALVPKHLHEIDANGGGMGHETGPTDNWACP